MVVEIKPIQVHQIQEIKQVIFTICYELWQLPSDQIKYYDAMSDIDDVQSHYYDNKGLFLVIIDNGKVVGSGAIRCFNDEICELKRMWILKEYRGIGLGKEMARMLLDFAEETGYKFARLDVFDKHKQAQAIRLYHQLGFYFIERYNKSSSTVFMEKIL
jgi:putative acetyltransferase